MHSVEAEYQSKGIIFTLPADIRDMTLLLMQPEGTVIKTTMELLSIAPKLLTATSVFCDHAVCF